MERKKILCLPSMSQAVNVTTVLKEKPKIPNEKKKKKKRKEKRKRRKKRKKKRKNDHWHCTVSIVPTSKISRRREMTGRNVPRFFVMLCYDCLDLL